MKSHLIINPLNLPEIVARIGYFIPLWGKDKESLNGPYRLQPQDLMSAALVNRLFYSALTPILWFAFRDSDCNFVPLAPPTYPSGLKFPFQVALANSHHFRIIEMSRGLDIVFHSTKLQSLTIGAYFSADLTCDLILANPNLTHLSWDSPRAGPNDIYPRVLEALNSLHHLRHLSLSYWNLYSDDYIIDSNTDSSSSAPDLPVLDPLPHFRLRTVLSNNSLHLERLDFQYIQGLCWIEEWVNFPKLHTLSLDCIWSRSPALHHLVQFCPSLKNLMLHADSDCDVNVMTPLLRDFCPKLESIRCVDGYMMFQSGWLLEDSEYVTLIQECKKSTSSTVSSTTHPEADEKSSDIGDQSNNGTFTQLMTVDSSTVHVESGLKVFEMALGWLDDTITNALLTHCNNLETLELYICGDERISFINANRLLSLCPNLESFAMFRYLMHWSASDAVFLFKTPWACHKLRSFNINGIAADDRGSESIYDGEEQGSVEHEHNPVASLGDEVEPEGRSAEISDQNNTASTCDHNYENDQQSLDDKENEYMDEDKGSDVDSIDMHYQDFLPKNWRIRQSNDNFCNAIEASEVIVFAKELFSFTKTISTLNRVGINYLYFDKIDQ